MEVDGDAISFSHTINSMLSAKASCLSAKRAAHVLLNIRIHVRKGQFCFVHVQAWVFKTKISPVISVYVGFIGRMTKNAKNSYENDWAVESILAAMEKRKALFFFCQKSNPDSSMLNLAV
jgi:hypothetical protein